MRSEIRTAGNDGQPDAGARALGRVASAFAAEPPTPDERFFHEDLPGLDESALKLELHRLRVALLFSERPSLWALERVGRIEGELKERRAR